LFAYSSKRVELLNKSGGFLWHLVDHTFKDELFLALARLLDPAETGKKKNLSIQFLLTGCKDCNPKLIEWTDALENIYKKAEPIRRYRNKCIAHSDFTTSKEISLTKSFDETITLDFVYSLLKDMSKLLRKIHYYYFSSGILYPERNTSESKGACAVLIALEKARRYDEWRKQQPNKHELQQEIIDFINAKPEEP